jgi:hypothetical protein
MKHRILAIAITFFFGIATYILVRNAGSESTKTNKRTIDRVVHAPVNKLLNPVITKENLSLGEQVDNWSSRSKRMENI